MAKPLNFDLKKFRTDFELDQKRLANIAELRGWTIRRAENFDTLSANDRNKIHISLINTFAGRRKIPVISQYSADEVEAAFFLVFPEYRLGRDRDAIDLETEVVVVQNIGYILAWTIDTILLTLLGKFALQGLDDLRSYSINYLRSMIADRREQYVLISCFRVDAGVSAEFYFRLSCLATTKPDQEELELSLKRFLFPETHDVDVEELVHRQSAKCGKLPIIGYRLKGELANRNIAPSPVIRNINLWFRLKGDDECHIQVSSYPQFHDGIRLIARTPNYQG